MMLKINGSDDDYYFEKHDEYDIKCDNHEENIPVLQ